MRERLQKVIAAAGLASRREAEELIRAGKVRVNGRVITEMGKLVEASRDDIFVNGERLIKPEKKRTIMLYKPRGVITTMSDPEGRHSVADLVQDEPVRLFPVGRLDRQSEGLLLLTNDGQLANLLTHPRHGVRKIYHAELSREADPLDLQKFEKGIELEDGLTKPTVCEPLPLKIGYWYKIVISEGRNRQIRRMFEALGYVVVRLRRVQVGNLKIGDLKPGQKRELTGQELQRLRAAAQVAEKLDGRAKKGKTDEQTGRGDRRRTSGAAGGLERRKKRSAGNAVRAERTTR